jgi:hypothetical protein
VAEGLAGVPEEEEIDTSWVTADAAYRIVAAMLIQALREAVPPARRHPLSMTPAATKKRREDDAILTGAVDWLSSTSVEPWSCRWACDVLGIDHDAVVRALNDPRAVAQQMRVMR